MRNDRRLSSCSCTDTGRPAAFLVSSPGRRQEQGRPGSSGPYRRRSRSGHEAAGDTTAESKDVLLPPHSAIERVELSAQDVKPFSDRRPDGPLEVADVVSVDVPRGRTGVMWPLG